MLVASVFAAIEEPDRLGSMAVYFLIAVAVTGPYALVRVRRIRRDRAELTAARQAAADADLAANTTPATDSSTTDSGEATIGQGDDGRAASDGGAGDDADDLVAVIDAIEAGRSGRDEEFEVRVAAQPRLNGRPADATTVDALVQDALRRSGVIVVADETSPDGRVLTCRPGHT